MNDHIPLEDLSARVDDELAPARRDQVDAHLAACPDCREQLESLRWSVALTHSMPKAQLPPGTSLRVPVDEAAPPVWRRLFDGGAVAWAGAAAVAIVALGIAALGAWSVSGGVGTQDESMAMVEGASEEQWGDTAMEIAEDDTYGSPGSAAEAADAAGAAAGADEAGAVAESDASEGIGAEDLLAMPKAVGTADLDIGHPEPLSSARAADERDRGFLPPPERVIDQPEPDTTALALSARARRADAAGAARMAATASAVASVAEAGQASDRDLAAAPPALVAPEIGGAVRGATTEEEQASDRGKADEESAMDESVDESDADASNAQSPVGESADRLGAEAEDGDSVAEKSADRTAADGSDEGAVSDESSAADEPETLPAAEGSAPGTESSAGFPLVPVAALAAVLLALSALLYVRARR